MGSQLGASLTSNFATGMNTQGVEITSLALSIEDSVFDSTANSAGIRAWGMDVFGVDSKADRVTELREAFAYFAGVSAATPPGTLGFSNRRRLVVLQGVSGGQDASGGELTQWRILLNEQLSSGVFGSADAQLLAAAINSVHPAPANQNYASWSTANSLPSGLSGPFQDADGDGDENIKEFFFFTSPTDNADTSAPVFQMTPTPGHQMTFRRAKNIVGVEMKLKSSTDLVDWSTEVVLTPTNTSVVDQGDYEEVTVTLPLSGAFRFYRIELRELN